MEACCTTLVCRLVGGPVVLSLARRRVTLTTVPRGVAVQMAVTMTMCASAVYNCKTSPPTYIILTKSSIAIWQKHTYRKTPAQKAWSLVNVIRIMS